MGIYQGSRTPGMSKPTRWALNLWPFALTTLALLFALVPEHMFFLFFPK